MIPQNKVLFNKENLTTLEINRIPKLLSPLVQRQGWTGVNLLNYQKN